jgi:ADP-heptose:LPS heptosyltransferase
MTVDAFGEWTAFRDAPVRVVLSPTNRREPRRWPLDRYAALADRLVREWQASVVWLWGPGEEADVDQAISLCREKTIKAMPTRFREMAALLANADLFFGNSNGPSHVAVAVGIPTLELHGPTLATSWCPMTSRHRAVQGSSMGDIAAESAWSTLQAMKPEVDAQAASRRVTGFKSSWV